MQTPLQASVSGPASIFRRFISTVYSVLLVIGQPAVLPRLRAADPTALPAPGGTPSTQPLVWTDKADYAPGETVTLFGLDFAPGEAVLLQVTFADGRVASDASHQPWSVTADPTGMITGTWIVTPDCFGALLILTATGRTSARVASVLFSDATGVAPAPGDGLAWGYGWYGQLGNGLFYTVGNRGSATPVAVSALPGGRKLAAVAARDSSTLALANDKTLWSWGQGSTGQLGTGSAANCATPVPVASLPGGRTASAIANGFSHSLALATDGRILAWGQGLQGQLGHGAWTDSFVPVLANELPLGRKAVAIASGSYYNLALADDGTLWAWGMGYYGTLGNGLFYTSSPTGSSMPVAVNAIPGGRVVIAISAANQHSLALASDGTLWAWGLGLFGNLGDGIVYSNAPNGSATPVQVNALPGGRTITAISAGGYHSLVLASDGTLWTWGLNNLGQLGNGTLVQSAVPVPVNPLPGGRIAVKISAGTGHNLVLANDNSLWAWGQGNNGQLGNGVFINSPIPVQVSGLPAGEHVAAIAAGTHNVVILGSANAAPSVSGQSVSTLEDVPVGITLAGSDPEGQPLTYTIVQNPAHGSLAMSPNLTYAPATHYNGPDSFTFTATDSTGAVSSPATVTIDVIAVNDAPNLAPPGNKTINELSALSFTLAASDVENHIITYSIRTGGLPGMSLDTGTGAFSWTPSEAQGPGVYNVTFRATDNGTPALFHEQTVRMTVGEVNLTPSLASPGNKAVAWGNELTFTLAATDPDLPANVLMYSISAGALPGMTLTANSFSWTPANNQVGTGTVTFRVTDGGGLFSEQTIAIDVGRRATALVYDGDIWTQYSDQPLLSATLTDAGGGTLHGSPIGGQMIGFTLGAQSTSATTNAAGRARANAALPMQAPTLAPQPPIAVACFFNDPTSPYLPASVAAALSGAKEDASIVYSGSTYFATANSRSDTATLVLTGTAIDANDSGRGDIRKAKMEFHRDAPNGPLLGTADLAIGLVDASDVTVGVATTPTFDYTLSGSERNAGGVTLNVYAVVKGWYTGVTGPDVITIAVPDTESVSSGGYLVLQSSSGEYAGDVGSKCSFGCTMKYNKGGRNLQGHVNILIRRGDRVYQVKSNAIDSLAATAEGDATVITKANLTDITNPQHPISVGGNLTLQIEMRDQAQGGRSDEIAITLSSSSGGLLFSSHWDGTRTVKQALGGGNVFVK